jgi:hypothetical protein
MLELKLNKKLLTTETSFADEAGTLNWTPSNIIPAYNQGQYFSGTDTSLDPDGLLALHHSFTIEAWIRPDVKNADMAVFSVTLN